MNYEVITVHTSKKEQGRISKIWIAELKAEKAKLEERLANLVYAPYPANHFTDEPTAVKYHREQYEQRKKIQKEARKILTGNISVIVTWARSVGLQYRKPSPYQHRIYSSDRDGLFVDWWDGKKRSMVDSNGNWGHQGENKQNLIRAILELL